MEEQKQPRIWPPNEAFYIEAMLFCLHSLESSLNRANRLMETIGDWPDDDHQFETGISSILDQFQNIAAQAAALSRFLWPSRSSGVHSARASQIQEALSVSDDSPLKNRDLRNLMEHFDERLDIYLSEGVMGNVIPCHIGPSPIEHEVPTHYFRAYYWDTREFEALGERYEMKPILDEAARIHNELIRCANEGFRLRPAADDQR